MPSIFVNIAAYRDPECLLTIHDLLDKARWPERIIFGAILQTRPEDEFAFYSTKFNAIYLDAQTSKGEEITMAVRLWTHGWDLFSPSYNLIWHQYGRAGARRHWDDDVQWTRFNAPSLARARHLLGMSGYYYGTILEDYRLGTVRSLAEYEQFSGVDFKSQTITLRACNGRGG